MTPTAQAYGPSTSMKAKTKTAIKGLLIGLLIGSAIVAVLMWLAGCAAMIDWVNKDRPPSRFEHSPEEYRR